MARTGRAATALLAVALAVAAGQQDRGVTMRPTAPAASGGGGGGDDKNDDGWLYAVSAFGAVVGVTISLTVCFMKRRHKRAAARAEMESATETCLELFAVGHNVEIPREIPRDNIRLLRILGAGQFGEVKEGAYLPPGARLGDVAAVAVKTLKDTADPAARGSMLLEAAITAQFSSQNIIKLVGIVTIGGPLLMVLELCQKGSLHAILATCWPGLPDGGTEMLIKYAHGIANGMEHLAQRSFCHRDLATRNVLIDGFDNCKVADFGLSRAIHQASKRQAAQQDGSAYYRMETDGPLPIAWLSPEAMVDKVFGEASDVWAFGVTMGELFTGARRPYGDWIPLDIMFKVKEGYVLPRPDNCPSAFYRSIVAPCLSMKPYDRPRFADLASRLTKIESSLAASSAAPAADTGATAANGAGAVMPDLFGGGGHNTVADGRPAITDSTGGSSVARVTRGGPGFYSAAVGVLVMPHFSEAADGLDPGLPGDSDGPSAMAGTSRTGAASAGIAAPKDAEVPAGKTEFGGFEDEQPGTPGFTSIPTPSIGYMQPTAIQRSYRSATTDAAAVAEPRQAAVGAAVGQYSTVAYADDKPDGGRQTSPLLLSAGPGPGPEDGRGESEPPTGRRYSLI